MGLDMLGKVIRKRGIFYCGCSFCTWLTGGRHLLDADNIKVNIRQPIWDVLCRSWEWKIPYHSLYRLLGFGIGELWEVTAL
jgi:hypothetical protein